MTGVRRSWAWIPFALATAHAHADAPDPRQLFKEARYDAAAAGFEQRFDRTRKAIDGINAVIAWRAAGHYAHARALLHRMRPTVSTGDTALVVRVKLLERKLAELTGTIVLTHLLPESAVTIDDRPAEFEMGEALVDVGMHEIAIAHTGCEPVREIIAVLPDQRISHDATLSCTENNGNLHVRISGLGADAYVDGEDHKIAASAASRRPPTASAPCSPASASAISTR
jgi:hypothetical protein